jgi:RNA polymerase sigma factor (sigma-70 family)
VATTAAATAITAATTEAKDTGRRSLSPSAGRVDVEAAGAYVGELFAEHGRMVLGLARLLLRDPVEAEDAAQQVFLSAHQAVLRGSVPRDPPPWLAAITRNECRARVRARMREPLALPELPSDLPDPLAAAIRAADLQSVWAALGALPRRQRRALLLRELGGLSYHELGRALGVSHSAVESLLFRARQQLRMLLAGANARFAALPVAWKVAGAAVSVGVVATGASGVDQIPIAPPIAHLHPVVARVAAVAPSPHIRIVAAVDEVPAVRAHVRPRRDAVEQRRHRRRHAEPTEAVEPVEEPAEEPAEQPAQEASKGSGLGPSEAVQLEVSNEGPGSGSGEVDDGHRDHAESSGRSGSDGGSDHSGPG